MNALIIFNTLGRRSKLALAARDAREMQDVFGHRDARTVDRAVSDDVLARCDKYAAKVRK